MNGSRAADGVRGRRAGEPCQRRADRVLADRCRTAGRLREMDDFWTQPGHRTAEHIHPVMQERWEDIAGSVCFRIAGVERIAVPGEVVLAPAGAPHMAWNLDAAPVHLRIQMRPALRWELFVERLFTLARSGHGDERGVLDPALMIELLREFIGQS
jgi:mannose-6-phosphate isomerase-like protein (cupin superfamily)